MFAATFTEPCSENPRGSRSHCRVNSRARPQSAGIPMYPFPNFYLPKTKALGFMCSKFLGLKFLVSGFSMFFGLMG